MNLDTPEPHLIPYLDAAAKYGGGFGSLLWASPKTQRARFDAMSAAIDLHGRSLLDAGCGRADLLGHLLQRGVQPSEYVGLEAVEALAAAAEARRYPAARIVRGDFVNQPARLFVASDVVVFSGSLNTLDDQNFYKTLQRAFDAAIDAVVFNFLCSDALAGKKYLFWRAAEDVRGFCRTLSARVDLYDDYLPGDCTMSIRK